MENSMNLERHFLVCIAPIPDIGLHEEYFHLRDSFCGVVIDATKDTLYNLDSFAIGESGTIYICGDVQALYNTINSQPNHVKMIRELSSNVEDESVIGLVSLGEVPIHVHGLGVYFRDWLSSPSNETNYFEILQAEHRFQDLTESNKPGKSFRKGIYLSEVEVDEGVSKFNLLRCSTNLNGPTLAFSESDREIVHQVNVLARRHFDQPTNLNHVLAQVYENSVTLNEQHRPKEHKAKIKSHSDKTKDMPASGLIAFCTFYSSDVQLYQAPAYDRFNRTFKETSVLTQLRFRRKDSAKQPGLVEEFRVLLYPNSIFLIPLSTNRLYTHEIVPPTLPVGKFPTRLGYVVRCSKTRAVFRDGATFIEQAEKQDVQLYRPNNEEFATLKKLYQEENVSAERIHYPEIWFSMNDGDFHCPGMA